MARTTETQASQATIEFVASVNKVQTMVDGGLRVVLDFDESSVMQAAQLIECKRFGVALNINAVPISLTELDGETKKDAERSGARVGRRRSANRRDQRTSE
jgi:hypothetical protein